jgi:hypothetical protein
VTDPDCSFERAGRKANASMSPAPVPQRSVTPVLSQFGSRFQLALSRDPSGQVCSAVSLGLIACGPMNDGAMDSRSSAGRKWRGMDEPK